MRFGSIFHYVKQVQALATEEISAVFVADLFDWITMLDSKTLLRSSEIDGGNVLWQEDISDLTALLEQLEENNFGKQSCGAGKL